MDTRALGVLCAALMGCATAQPVTPRPVNPKVGASKEANMRVPRVERHLTTSPTDDLAWARVRLTGPINVKAVVETITQQYPALRSCYEPHLKTDPTLHGAVIIRAIINPEGRVEATTVNEVLMISDLMDGEPIARCVRSKLQGWRFPCPDSAEATIELVVIFEPKP